MKEIEAHRLRLAKTKDRLFEKPFIPVPWKKAIGEVQHSRRSFAGRGPNDVLQFLQGKSSGDKLLQQL